MSYYMAGDYRRGDFYRGDPGFFSFLGGIAKKAVGFIPGVGPIASAALEKIPLGGSKSAVGRMIPRVGEAITTVGKTVAKHPVLSAAGAAGAAAAAGGLIGRETAAGVPMKGFHISRKTGKLVKNRHMRVTNPRALRRSLRRIHGFSRLARKVIHITHPRARGRAVFKFKRRKRA